MTLPAQTVLETPATAPRRHRRGREARLPGGALDDRRDAHAGDRHGHARATLGPLSIGAAGFAGLWVWTLFVPFTGTAQGVQVFVSRHDGAGEPERCGPWIWQAVWLLVPAMCLWMFAVAFLFPKLVAFIGPSPEMQAAAIGFGWARLPGGPAVVFNFAVMSFFRGIGDTRTPLLRDSRGGRASNVVVAYGLIFGALGLPAWGVVGAGAAQSAASWVYAALFLPCCSGASCARAIARCPSRRAWRRWRASCAPARRWAVSGCST